MEIEIRSKMCRFVVLLAVVLGIAACSKPAYIGVLYQPPAPSYLLEGRQVVLQVRDQRADTSMFGENAREQFKHFTGIFALSVPAGQNGKSIVGAFELQAMFYEGLKRRLENVGMTVLAEGTPSTPTVEVNLKRFLLDLQGRTWKTDVAYQASLIQDGKVRGTQTVSGTAERFKIIGSGDAEKVLGDVFTEMVNKFNMQDLLHQAGLL